LLRDLLLQVAHQGVYSPRWSEEILNEMVDAVVEIKTKKLGGDPARVAGVRRGMETIREALNAGFPEAMVENWHSLTPGLMVPDPDDRHVVAAAVAASASVIITHNLGDFPSWSLPAALEVQHPDEFLLDALHLRPRSFEVALRATAAQTGQRGGTQLKGSEVLDKLRPQIPNTVAVITAMGWPTAG